MLNEHEIEFTYRDYRNEPLTRKELDGVLRKLKLKAHDVLRSRDAKKLGLSGDESDDELRALMVDNPTLLQRPIGVVGNKAAVGRPVENLLEIV